MTGEAVGDHSFNPEIADMLLNMERRPAAVLVPVIHREPEATVLFTERTGGLRSHAGQISFPGGRIDPDDAGPEAAALREAGEEIGLQPEFVETVGPGAGLSDRLGLSRRGGRRAGASGFWAADQPGRGRRRVRSAALVPDGPGQPSARKPHLERRAAHLLRDAVRRASHLGDHRRHRPHPLRAALCRSDRAASVMTALLRDWPLLKEPHVRKAFRGARRQEAARRASSAARCATRCSDVLVTDADLATVFVPAEVIARAEAAGLKTAPTGIEHGTVTVIADGRPLEVTTLRRDVETDGRRAVVNFTTDWTEDAARRDFTMNALYCDVDGDVLDPLRRARRSEGGPRALHRQRGGSHPRGLSPHPALLPVRRVVRKRAAGRGGGQGLRAAESRDRNAFGRARLGGAEAALQSARSRTRAALDAHHRGSAEDAAGKLGHRRHPAPDQSRRRRRAGRPIRCCGSRRFCRRTARGSMRSPSGCGCRAPKPRGCSPGPTRRNPIPPCQKLRWRRRFIGADARGSRIDCVMRWRARSTRAMRRLRKVFALRLPRRSTAEDGRGGARLAGVGAPQ